MPALRRAILADVHDLKLDPKVPHTQVDKSGKLVISKQNKKEPEKLDKINQVIFASKDKTEDSSEVDKNVEEKHSVDSAPAEEKIEQNKKEDKVLELDQSKSQVNNLKSMSQEELASTKKKLKKKV